MRIDFTTLEGNMPHSLVVIDDPGRENLPLEAGRKDTAFSRAYSKSPIEGISPGDEHVISLTAKKAGDYLWLLRCVRPRAERHVGVLPGQRRGKSALRHDRRRR